MRPEVLSSEVNPPAEAAVLRGLSLVSTPRIMLYPYTMPHTSPHSLLVDMFPGMPPLWANNILSPFAPCVPHRNPMPCGAGWP